MSYTLSQWIVSLKHYLLMCFFASAPDRLPYHLHSLLLTLLAYLLLGLTLVDEQRDYPTILVQVIIEVGLLALVTLMVLRWKRIASRFLQTLSALIGVNFVISLLALPVFLALHDSTGADASPGPGVIYASILVVFWNLAVISQIFRRAFEINTLMSAMIAFNYFLLYQFAIAWL